MAHVELLPHFRLTVNIRDKKRRFAVMNVVVRLQELEASLSPEKRAALRADLSAYINHLLLHDFTSLVTILYRVDVQEKGLKKILLENPEEDAGDIIADLLIQRQEEKIATRRSFPPADHPSDDERW
jgi:hypothetical protein